MSAKNDRTRKDCSLYEELLISRVVLNDISKTNDKKLTAHLKKCEACRQREKDLLLLNRASKNIPEIKPSRRFEKNLYKILEIPPLEKKKKASRFASLFRFEQGMRFLKPATAFLSIIFVQAVLLRVYFLPQNSRPEAKMHHSFASAKRSPLKTGRKAGGGSIEKFLGGHRIDARVSSSVETKTFYKKIRRKTIIRRNKLSETDADNTTVFAKKKPTRRAKRSPMKSKGLLKNLDNLNSNNEINKTPSVSEKSRNRNIEGDKQRADDTAGRGVTAGNMAPKSMADRNYAQQKSERALKKSVLNKISQDKSSPTPQAPSRKRDETKSIQLVRETEKIVTVTLKTDQQNRGKLQKLSPTIRKKVRKMYGKNARIRLRYAYSVPKVRMKKSAEKKHAARPHGNGAGYLIILIILALEGAVRILLIVDLKRTGRISILRILAAAFLGTLYLPFYLMRKQQ